MQNCIDNSEIEDYNVNIINEVDRIRSKGGDSNGTLN